MISTGTSAQGACPALKYNQSGAGCGQLTYHAQGDATAAACEQACCSVPGCDVWQWRNGTEASNGGGCWMAPFRIGPNRGCPPKLVDGPWVGASRVPHPLPTPAPSPPPPPQPSSWTPHWENRGSYDAVMCEGTPFWWPKDKRMYLMECVCNGPLDVKGWGSEYGYYWGHAEQWFPEYRNHSYIRIRELETGHVVQNISLSIGFGFGAAFVDYDHGTLWISATANDRVDGGNAPRPYGPPHDHSCRDRAWECNGVWVFNSSDLLTWTRRQTDVQWNGPNTDIARVYPSPSHPTPPNLPPHRYRLHSISLFMLPLIWRQFDKRRIAWSRYVMATESGDTWAVNNNADGDLSHGWVTLPSSKAHGGSEACPSVRYLPSDGYYYTVSGGNTIPLMRSKDLLTWETATGSAAPFIQPSSKDVLTASSVMASAAANLANGHGARALHLSASTHTT